MRRRGREEWQRDIDLRQRNVVFPDTAANETRFWRNIISGQQRLGITQVIGIILLYLAIATVVYSMVSTQLRFSDIHGTMWERIVGNFGSWIILLVISGGALLVGQLISHRSKTLRTPRSRTKEK